MSKQHIWSVKTENFKRVIGAELDVKGKNFVRIGGDNEHGKSSFVESFMAALNGKRHFGAKPVRDGAKKAKTHIETEDFLIDHEITADGKETLTLRDKDGGKFSAARTTLAAKMSKYMIDPTAFLALSNKEQVVEFAKRAGIDIEAMDRKRAGLAEDRKIAGREKERTAKHFDSLPEPPEPEDWEDVPELMDQLKAAQAHNAEGGKFTEKLDRYKSWVAKTKQEIAELQSSIDEANESIRIHNNEIVSITSQLAEFTPIDTEEFDVKIAAASSAQADQQKRDAYEAAEKDKTEAWQAWLKLNRKVEKCDSEKAQAAAEATLPIGDVGIEINAVDESYLTLDGVPLSEASKSKGIRFSCALVMHDDADFRLCWIENGSLLDEKSLAIVEEMAKENDYQVWCETVGQHADDAITLENGVAKEI